MKAFRTAIILLMILGVATTGTWAATITSAQSGPWSATSTWIGGVVPTTNDTALIMNIVTQNLATLEVFQIDIRNGCALLMDGSAATGDSMAHTIKFTDSSGCGFVTLTHGGTIIIKGDATYRQTVTTAAAGTPSNWWNFYLVSGSYSPSFNAEYATFSYFLYFKTSVAADNRRMNINNCTFTHAAYYNFDLYAPYVGSVSNVVLEYNNDLGINDNGEAFRGMWGGIATCVYYNVVMTNVSATYRVMSIYAHDYDMKLEFRDSNWNLDSIGTGAGQTYLYFAAGVTNKFCCLVSHNHNDVAGDYRLVLGNRMAETNLIQKFDRQNLKFVSKVYDYGYSVYRPGTLVVDREIKVNSLTMDDKSYLDLSAGKNLYYYNTATFTPANIIGPGQVLKWPQGTVFSLH